MSGEEIILSDREVEEAKGRITWRKVEEFVFRNRFLVLAGLLGFILLGAGIFLLRAGIFEGTRVEVISDSVSDSDSGQVVVEIAGEVIKPGVYQLSGKQRIEQLLIAAGGLSAEADREWVEKNLNRAARLADGTKIYVPGVGESVSQGVSVSGGQVVGSSVGRININTASQAQLESLWGIGQARASAIVEGRPYSSMEELLTKKIIPSNVYERIKNEITAP